VALVIPGIMLYWPKLRTPIPQHRTKPFISSIESKAVMKISDAKTVLHNDGFDLIEIRRNPSDIEEYIVLLYTHEAKSFMLAYENDTVLSSTDLGHIVLLLKEIGFNKAKIYF